MTTPSKKKPVIKENVATSNSSQELPSELQSSSELNQAEQQTADVTLANNLPAYSELDEMTKALDNTGEQSENKSEDDTENQQAMSQDDCILYAVGGVNVFENIASAYVGDKVTIPDKQKEELAGKAAVVVKKHFGKAELPPWLIQWKEEISLGIALGTCMFSIYQQKQEIEALKTKSDKQAITQDFATGAKTNGD